MATSNYNTATLLGNFVEEQSGAPPLRGGVLPDYGPIDYSTTHKADLKRPQKSRQYRPEQRNTVHRLITVEYIEEMALAPASDPNVKFSDALARADPRKAPDASGQYESTANASFGARPGRRGRRAEQLLAQQVGGTKPKSVDAKDVAPTGAYGERLREDSDPQRDTRAQRSWVYGGASMFPENQGAARDSYPRPELQPTSLDTRRLAHPEPEEGASKIKMTTNVTRANGKALTGLAPGWDAGVWAEEKYIQQPSGK
jgi:hypothetical protein